MLKRTLFALCLALTLSACHDGPYTTSARHLAPIPAATMALMASKGVSPSDPILLRAYKKESEIELWKRASNGRYALVKTYPMCRWSGQLGPKLREGDRQAPEGFYAVTPAAMNPNSSLFLSFDVGYPNAFDRAHGRTGAHLMVHGSCSSRGCFAMTDEAISEIYAVAREAFAGGQRAFQFQSYPFRMSAENVARHRQDPHIAFWLNLKEGSDLFEVTGTEPEVGVSGNRYVFSSRRDTPEATAALAQRQIEDERQVAALVAKGAPAVRLVYEDGDQHRVFREAMVAANGGAERNYGATTRERLGEVSRPEALAIGPREITLATVSRERPVLSLKPAAGLLAAKRPGSSGPASAKEDRQRPRRVIAAADSGEQPVRTTAPSEGGIE
jgi:murein L,D-transpeptidase YafK